MTWILNMIVSVNLRRVSVGITANGFGLGDARNLETLNYKQAVLRVLPIPC